ncbi:MAG: response regulator transcription factor [Arachnia propionica]|uniref:response regulator transcription factor n=1 Tax=Arachnia propionica TaxID=1750 RepID=UPI00270B2963|nr:response regulator transcription factor [Arachnia propionica]
MSRILVADDDPMIRNHLARILTRHDFTALTASDGVEALEVAKQSRPDLIVLDVMMPRADGREVLARLRRRGDWTPVILLTGVGQSGTRADALEKGADDYLNKPFDPAELVARIRAVLRRGQLGQTLSHASRVKGGGLELDRLGKTVQAKGKAVQLTPKALALLEYLMIHHGETFSRDHLLQQVWGVEFAITTRAVDHRVAELRKALGVHGLEVIDTVQGVGYRFHPEVRAV